MTAAAEAASEHGLVVGDADDIRLGAVRAPHLSVIQWLVAAGGPRGAQSAFASSIALASPPRSAQVVTALGMPALAQLPEFLVPLAPRHDSTVAENVTALMDALPDSLAAEVSAWPVTLPAPWRAAVDRPADWRDDFVRAVRAAWSAGRRYWERSRFAVDREITRIGTAAMTGSVPALLNSLHPRLHYRDGMLRFRNSCPTAVPLDGRRLVLVPILAPVHHVAVSFERSDLAYIAYPVLGQTRAAGNDEDRLELVVGQLRASALRHLVQPLTMQALAAEIHCAPSTATYHCDLLEAAALIARERRGSLVWVMRTRAGDALVDLLS
ncbi:MAG TPA: hypothetical protein VIG48_10830 [Jatrophihabitans sp.]|jgi:hypothetical protein